MSNFSFTLFEGSDKTIFKCKAFRNKTFSMMGNNVSYSEIGYMMTTENFEHFRLVNVNNGDLYLLLKHKLYRGSLKDNTGEFYCIGTNMFSSDVIINCIKNYENSVPACVLILCYKNSKSMQKMGKDPLKMICQYLLYSKSIENSNKNKTQISRKVNIMPIKVDWNDLKSVVENMK